MRPAYGGPRREFQLRWLWESPLLLVFWSLVLLGGGTAARMAVALRAAGAAQATVAASEASFVVEEAALLLATQAPIAPGERRRVPTAAGLVEAEARGDGWVLAQVARPELRFHCERLPGAAHPAFARAVAVGGVNDAVDVDGEVVRLAAMPELLPLSPGRLPGAVVRDSGVALLHLAAGSDRDDFRFAGSGDPVVVVDDVAGAVVVPGNLWIEAGGAPLHLELAADLTVVARGNVYIGRSVLVSGPGRLFLVAAAAAEERAFVDADGNGRWSPGDRPLGATLDQGPIEGAGAVWLGLPGRSVGSLTVQAGLMASHAVHVVARRAEVAGCLLAGDGLHGIGGERQVVARGEDWVRTERESVPGFAYAGLPRPGRPMPIDR